MGPAAGPHTDGAGSTCQHPQELDSFTFSSFKPKGELFNHGVGQNLAGDAFDLGLMRSLGQAILKRQEEILALANVRNAFVFHATKRIGNSLSLSVKDGSFQRDIDMGLHYVRL